MATFTEQLANQIDDYIEDLFVPADPILEANLRSAEAAGLPPIAITPNQGKFLYLLARIARAARILEIGTLGGYSTTWLARALPPEGRLITLEFSPKHAATARQNLDAAGLAHNTEIRLGDAATSLRALIAAAEPPFDLIFIDADKASYPTYLDLALRLARPGTVLIADNVVRNGAVLQTNPDDRDDNGARAYNAAVAAHPQLESIVLPMFKDKIDGMAISRVRA
jgi:predicted O-methyltransferase YrrM